MAESCLSTRLLTRLRPPLFLLPLSPLLLLLLPPDLKPDNIFLASDRRIVKLGDLGVAKQLEGTHELAITCLG